MFALLAESIEWANKTRDLSPVVQASRARDITESYLQPLRWNNIDTPDKHGYLGERYLDAFEDLARNVARWIDRHL